MDGHQHDEGPAAAAPAVTVTLATALRRDRSGTLRQNKHREEPSAHQWPVKPREHFPPKQSC